MSDDELTPEQRERFEAAAERWFVCLRARLIVVAIDRFQGGATYDYDDVLATINEALDSLGPFRASASPAAPETEGGQPG